MKSRDGITNYSNDYCQHVLTKVFPNQYLTKWPGIYHLLSVPDRVQTQRMSLAIHHPQNSVRSHPFTKYQTLAKTLEILDITKKSLKTER